MSENPAISESSALDTRQSVSSRRAVLCGAGGAAALAVCGCSSSASTRSSTPNSPAAAGSGSAPAVPSINPTGAAGDGMTATTPGAVTGSTASGSGTVLGKAADVPVGGGTVFPAAKVVVTQSEAGKYKAFSAVCTHRGCTVGSVAGGLIMCPCHGSAFKIDDGSVANGPATSALPPVAVKVQNGDLVTGA